MSTFAPRLIVRRGPDPNAEFVLAQLTSVIGREPLNDVVFADPEISRRHSRIKIEGQSAIIEDLGSTNGTFVNGRRISGPTALKHGDIVDLGETIRLTFLTHPDEDATGEIRMDEIEPPTTFEPGGGRLQTAPLGSSRLENVSVDDLRQQPPDSDGAPDRRNLYIGIGCASLLVISCSCFGVLFLLDRFVPELLYGWWPT